MQAYFLPQSLIVKILKYSNKYIALDINYSNPNPLIWVNPRQILTLGKSKKPGYKFG